MRIHRRCDLSTDHEDDGISAGVFGGDGVVGFAVIDAREYKDITTEGCKHFYLITLCLSSEKRKWIVDDFCRGAMSILFYGISE